MTDQQHPITPSPELVQQWFLQAHESADLDSHLSYYDFIATQSAQWGADQELEACCEWLDIPNNRSDRGDGWLMPGRLRRARRPKPPSLKEQALLQLDTLNADLAMHGSGCDLSQIRRALETLPND
jgi:hypothetical protein